jgi:putative redox protein
VSENWTEVISEWKGETSFIAHNATGGMVQMGTVDGHPGIGPMQLLLAAIAGCTGGDIASILEKKRQPLQDLKIRVRGNRADTYPRIYTDIEVQFLIWGEVDPKAVEQAIQLSEEKYCSVGAMLREAAHVTYSYQILKPGETVQ